MRIILALVAGSLFGAGLHISGMTDTTKVQGFLDFFGAWDVTLAFVMGGAIIPMAIAWRMVPGRAPLVGGSFAPAPDPALDRRLIAGSILFGVGWGLIGLCPGPAIASLNLRRMDRCVVYDRNVGRHDYGTRCSAATGQHERTSVTKGHGNQSYQQRLLRRASNLSFRCSGYCGSRV